jgi:hypothetical protein
MFGYPMYALGCSYLADVWLSCVYHRKIITCVYIKRHICTKLEHTPKAIIKTQSKYIVTRTRQIRKKQKAIPPFELLLRMGFLHNMYQPNTFVLPRIWQHVFGDISRLWIIDLKHLKIIWLFNISILSVPEEGYSRNASCALNLIFTFLFDSINVFVSSQWFRIYKCP